MSLRIDFSEVGDLDFSPIPSGVYLARITDGEIREAGPNAKHPGSQYINWEFTIAEGEHQGRKQWLNTSLLPDALGGLKSLLAATGKFDVSGSLQFDIEDVIGSEVAIVVRIQEYKGDKQNVVKRVKSAAEARTGGDDASSLLP